MKTKRIVMSALLAALTTVATMLIRIPTPLKGYINLGDCTVLLCAFLLPPCYSFLAAGIGSALADVFSGYVIYAPATFLIKGLMALTVYFIYKTLKSKFKPILSKVISGVLAEVVMVLGYFLFEGILYGFLPSLVNVPLNIVQGIVGLIAGVFITRVFEKVKIF